MGYKNITRDAHRQINSLYWKDAGKIKRQNNFVVLFKNSGCPLRFMVAAICLAFSHQHPALMMNPAACTEIVLKPLLTVLMIYFLGFLYAQNSTKRSIKERLMKLLPCSAAKTTSPVTQSKFYFSFFSFDFFFFLGLHASKIMRSLISHLRLEISAEVIIWFIEV